MSNKLSVRFYKNREVRAIWSNEDNKWYFSALDLVGAINEQDDYQKNRNYWKYLKNKIQKNGIQLGSITNQMKLQAPDGKRRIADVISQDGVNAIATAFPNNKATDFLNWFTYSENTIDGQSRKKAYTFIESNLIADKYIGTVKCLQQIHAYIFGGLYDFAGKIRTKTIAKGNTLFCLAEYLHQNLQNIEQMPQTTFDQIVDKYVEMNVAHPFMEGNGRSTRIWLDLILKKNLAKCVDWSQIDKNDYLNAMIESHLDSTRIKALLSDALTDKINDREMFMKGIDYSYYYEQNDTDI